MPIRFSWILILLSACFAKVNAQVSISGPTCVFSSTQYSYLLSAYYSGSSNYSYSISGGTLSTGGSSGTHSGPGTASIIVTWTSSGSITLNSPAGYTYISVQLTSALAGGTISSGQSQNISYNSTPASLVCAAASGGTCNSPSYQYQWQLSPDNISFQNITGATSQNYSFSAGATETFYYRRFVQEMNSGNTAYSNVASVIINPPNPILAIVPGIVSPATQNINYSTNATALSVSGLGGGNYAYSFQWQSSPDNLTWTNVPATLLNYTPASLISSAYYRVAVTSNGSTAYSSAGFVNVYPQIQPGIITPDVITISSGGNPGGVFSSVATGGNGTYSYQWQNSSDGINFANLGGASAQYYLPGTLTSNTWYRMTVTSNGAVSYSTPASVVVNATSPDLNFIRIREILKPGVTDTLAAGLLTSAVDVRQTTQFFDGLGRPIQTVLKQQSPLQYDAVSLNTYDGFGREVVKFMPYIATTTDGNYKLSGAADQYNFNASQYPSEKYFFNHSYIESSPLNRINSIASQGLNWEGSGRSVKSQYAINNSGDSVRIWTIAMTAGSFPSTNASYTDGILFKSISTDEAGHQIIEYKDLEGKSILKKVQLSSVTVTGHSDWLCTYYVYDVLGQLRFIIPPQAIAAINNNWNLTSSIANELCFRYEYDHRHRMIIKKIPGAGETWLVYDSRNRLVMTQDSLLRTKQKWSYTRFDCENRPDSTGMITDPINYYNLAYHLNLAAASCNYPIISSYTSELLTQTFYDDYSWASAAGLNQTMATSITNNSANFFTTYNTLPNYPVNPVPNYITRGKVTGTITKVLGTVNQFLPSITFYDDHGRALQNQTINYTGAIDTSTSQYSYTGLPLRSLNGHRKDGSNAQSHTTLTKMNYDAGGRLLTVYKNIDNTGEQLITTNTYNELGELNNKVLGNGLENLSYEYNVRGWIKSINKNYVAGTSSNFFGMELAYDNTGSVAGTTSYAAPQYNGNIAGTIWKSKGDGINRKFDFLYDNVNRITNANFVQNTSGSTWDNSYLDFSVGNLSYDANGNILSMNQKGFKINGSGLIDQLTYTYQDNSNKLKQVEDAANDPASKLGDFHYSGTKQAFDYSYDGNGNMITDNNKAISAIVYNSINLPQTITITGKGSISYVYDATGNKIKKIVQESGKPDQLTLYLGGFVYQNDSVQFTGHEEGRVRWAFHKYLNGTINYGWEYDFFLKDHLGNVRMVLTQQKDTTQYIATMEAAYRSTENTLFNNIPQSAYATSIVTGYPTDNTTVPNDSLARVNGNGLKTGPSLLLKVMSGDGVDIAVKSFYKSGGTVSGPNNSFNDVLNSLANGIVGISGTAHGVVSDMVNSSSSQLYSGLNSFLNTNDPNTTGKPKAYLNWILMDDQFKAVTTYPQSGAIPVGGPDLLNTLSNSGISITKNGYLYIWVSNETPGWDVFFDNLSVKQFSGRILEETHYYAFGLPIAGLSSKAAGKLENKFKYSGKSLENNEFSDGSGLDEYDFGARFYNAQIGRWTAVDPFASKYTALSPYNYALNNPLRFLDPNGLFVVEGTEEEKKALNRLIKEEKKRLGALSEDSKEMKALLSASGFKNKKDLMAIFKNGSGPVMKFGSRGEDLKNGSFLLEPNGKGGFSSKSAYAGTDDKSITLAPQVFDVIQNIQKAEKAGSFEGLLGAYNTSVSGESDKAFNFFGKIVEHEIAHYGAAVNPDMTPMVITLDESGNNVYHERGDYYETQAYGKPSQWTDSQSGAAVYVEFRLQSFGCADRLDKLGQCQQMGSTEAVTQRGQAISNWMQSNGFSKK